MNIDDLSKSQLLLLTLLVNFVMSIATGIVTVSLLDEAPPIVTQTVNRIVEHTVETVVPSAVVTNTRPTQQTSEEDRLVSAVSAAQARTVFLYRESTSTPALAQAIYLPRSRTLVAFDDGNLPSELIVGFPNGSAFPASRIKRAEGLMLYGFADAAILPAAPAAGLVPSASLKQGQAVIAIQADGSAVTGIISKSEGTAISTTLPTTARGAAAVDLSGQVIGISTGGNSYVSADLINLIVSAPAGT